MKRILPIGILLMLSYSLPAFGTSSPRPAGMTVETCTVDGLERTYRLYLPEGVPDDAPLVFVLHGYGGNFNLDRYGMNEAADPGDCLDRPHDRRVDRGLQRPIYAPAGG